jgi:hypothetical protein
MLVSLLRPRFNALRESLFALHCDKRPHVKNIRPLAVESIAETIVFAPPANHSYRNITLAFLAVKPGLVSQSIAQG